MIRFALGTKLSGTKSLDGTFTLAGFDGDLTAPTEVDPFASAIPENASDPNPQATFFSRFRREDTGNVIDKLLFYLIGRTRHPPLNFHIEILCSTGPNPTGHQNGELFVPKRFDWVHFSRSISRIEPKRDTHENRDTERNKNRSQIDDRL